MPLNNLSLKTRPIYAFLRMGLISLTFVAPGSPHFSAFTRADNHSANRTAVNSNQPRRDRVPRARNKTAKKSLKSGKERTPVSRKNDSQTKSAPKNGATVLRSGRASTSSGTSTPRETKGQEGKESQSPTDRDKLLDQVNLPVPVPPGKVTNHPPSSPVDPPSSPGEKKPTTAKTGVGANRPAPARRPHGRKDEN